MKNTKQVVVSGVVTEITHREALEIQQLAGLPGWDLFLGLLTKMEQGTRDALEDIETPLDDIRALQGRLGVAKDVVKLVTELMPAVAEALRKDDDA